MYIVYHIKHTSRYREVLFTDPTMNYLAKIAYNLDFIEIILKPVAIPNPENVTTY